MAKKIAGFGEGGLKRVRKVTSIGGSSRTRPKNKSKRKNWKKQKGQGSGRR